MVILFGWVRYNTLFGSYVLFSVGYLVNRSAYVRQSKVMFFTLLSQYQLLSHLWFWCAGSFIHVASFVLHQDSGRDGLRRREHSFTFQIFTLLFL